MALAMSNFQMEIATKEDMCKDKPMEKVNIFGKIKLFTLAILLTDIEKEKDN